MDSFELDLCISCGTHVADGTPYCSSRCRKADSQQQPSPSSSSPRSAYLYAGSSSQGPSDSSHYYAPAHSHSQRRRPLLDLQEQSFFEDEHQVSNKLASIAEWAQGVYGSYGEEEDCLRMKAKKASRRGSTPTSAPTPTPMSTKKVSASTATPRKPVSSSLSPARHYSPPRFTLTAQNLAPPAMSIATVDDSDLSSIATPSSSPSDKKVVMIKAGRKSTEVDPWISSPPYEFAYKQHHTERGRPLVRV
ncbi:hypothetical protein M407DRAFT_242433 [Tulasnella calospora MUT 4182]|uniref:Uncharacterized protein n=1 Tax=Tulasnella calospora MUT 4182 TaxID=1051891 RepID=A0A0C3QQP7_9AGAM|nr:hypothetical protein M407DRAFT_242433 [Tulasnella calospora MUT 4182]